MSNKLRILSHTGVTATAEISVSCIRFHSTKTNLEGGYYYVDKLLFSNCLHIAVILTWNMFTDNKSGTSRIWSR